jgi:hypothetical protein
VVVVVPGDEGSIWGREKGTVIWLGLLVVVVVAGIGTVVVAVVAVSVGGREVNGPELSTARGMTAKLRPSCSIAG